jgi:hypothetical protein
MRGVHIVNAIITHPSHPPHLPTYPHHVVRTFAADGRAHEHEECVQPVQEGLEVQCGCELGYELEARCTCACMCMDSGMRVCVCV